MPGRSHTTLPSPLRRIKTPLHPEAWERLLKDHPDKGFTQYLLHGVREGFRIGFQGSGRCRQAKRNLRSAYEHPLVVDAYLRREVELERMVRLPAAEARAIPWLQVSPIGVIPKRNRPNAWRLIVDLSSPEGHSVNDGVDRAECSIKYASIDDAVRMIRALGAGTLMAKADLKEAYRMVPVQPEDRPLLAMKWKEAIFIDTALPFGLRSAPKISALADGLLWILHNTGTDQSLHYLDDFLILGQPNTPECVGALQTFMTLCEELGVPIEKGRQRAPVQLSLSWALKWTAEPCNSGCLATSCRSYLP